MSEVRYDPYRGTLYHFYQHVQFGLAPTIPRYDQKKNWLEKLGDVGLWTIENFPHKAWKLMKAPRWMTLVLTHLSLAGVSALFYPKESAILARVVWLKFALPSREAVKFAIYLVAVGHILSAACRAYGRFCNEELMKAWYTDGASLMSPL